MNDRWLELQDVFDEVCPLTEPARQELLDRRCAGDPDFRADVQRLLDGHDGDLAASAASRSASAHRIFGVWETVRLLGRGGMGEVWLARRADGQHEQHAALKVLSPYLAAPEYLDRFRRERQLLARLEHPNIARLLDGGMSESGEPYLVMELVDGARLDRYCAEHAPSTEQRLSLFCKICAAVHSAHQHFIVHRDLKPGNILITAEGEPKLLDFGIAKVLDSESGLEQTATANLFLTPVYASPEILRGLPATVASDVYSLGVVLYELLSGRRPFDPAKTNPVELVRAITEIEPAPPGVGGDLDLIVLKALAKNPRERYGSVAQLDEDIQRYLHGEPVAAVPASRLYIARKFVRRNRAAVAAAAVLFLSLAGGLAGTLWQARAARQGRASAEQRFSDARQMANYLLFDLYDSVATVPGTLPVRADMARRSLQYLDRLSAIKSGDPALRLELAEGYLKLSSVLSAHLGRTDNLGDTRQAIENSRKALSVIEPLLRERPADRAAQRTGAAIEEQLGGLLFANGRYDEAFSRIKKAAAQFQTLADAKPADLKSHIEAGASWQTLGTLLSEKGSFVMLTTDPVATYFDRSVKDLKTAMGIDPSNTKAVMLLALSEYRLGKIQSGANPKSGLETLIDAANLLTRVPGGELRSAQYAWLPPMVMLQKGWCEGQLGNFTAALSHLRAGREALEAQYREDPKDTVAEYHLADACRSLGIVEGYAGHPAESLAASRQAIDLLTDVLKRDPTNTLYPASLAEVQGRAGKLLAAAGRMEEARPYVEANIAYFKRVAATPGATAGQLMEAVRCVAESGVKSLRDYPLALRFALKAEDVAKGKNPAVLGYLAEAYALNGDFPAAVAAARKGLEIAPAPQPGEPASKLRAWLEEEVRNYGARRLS